jgi:hypothetical protein
MYVPLAILAIAGLLAWAPLRRLIGSESLLALGLALIAVVALFQLGRLG